MASSSSIARAIDRAVRRIAPNLAHHLRGNAHPSALRGVRIEHNPHGLQMAAVFEFFAGPEWGHTFHDYEIAWDRDVCDGLRSELRSLYSRVYEDELLWRALEPMRRRLCEMQMLGAPVHEIMRLRDQLHQREHHLRRHHREHAYVYGVDHAAPGSERTAVSMSWRGVNASISFDEADLVTDEQMQVIMAQHRQQMAEAFAVPSPWLQATEPYGYRYVRPEGANNRYAKAEAKGLALLKAWLSPEQLAQYESQQSFDVIGGTTGTRYRIHHGRQQNIAELDAKGDKVCGWCFLPEGQLVAGDVMLAQKIALETNEQAALKVANKLGGRVTPNMTATEVLQREAEYLAAPRWSFAAPRAGVVVMDPTS